MLPLTIAAHPGSRPSLRSSRRLAVAIVSGLILAIVGGLTPFVSVGSAVVIPNCVAPNLSARIVSWQGAAGSRIADVQLVNTSFVACAIRDYPRVQLMAGHGAALIKGAAPSTTATRHVLAALHTLRTEVSASNYCGPAYLKPVTLAFVLPGLLGRVVAIPLSATDVSGVPPCNGAPGSAGHISMHAWH